MATDAHVSPVAQAVIEKCGGFETVAEWLDLDLSNVYRFTYPRSRGGTGGLIPAKHQTTLLAKARDVGVDLRPEDFFEVTTVPSDEPGSSTPERAA